MAVQSVGDMGQDIVQLDNGQEYKLICQGNTAEVFWYDETKILKLFRDNFPLEVIQTEFETTRRISQDLAFVPKVFGLVEYKNRYGILYEKADGKDMIAEMMKKPCKIRAYSKQLAAVHTRIHGVTAELKEDIKSKLTANIGAAAELSEREKKAIVAYLQTLPNGKTLCHFDFHPGNVMIKSNGFFVIDWMTAGGGEAAADVARTYLLLRYGELLYASFFVKLIAHIAERRIGKIYLHEYEKLTGMTDGEIKKWLLPIAAARLIEWIPKHEKRKLLKFIKKELAKIS